MPPGVALSGPIVEAVAGGDEEAIGQGREGGRGPCRAPLAVRSSAVDEDGADASFAGQHLTLLNVPSAEDVPSALREIWWSANSDSAITYRQRVGLFTRPSVGVVVQSLLDPDVAGRDVHREPVTGADERVIEASWGLGEAVVAGLVIPDTSGSTAPGRCSSARRAASRSRSAPSRPAARSRRRFAPELAEQLCLDDGQLERAEPARAALRAGLRPGARHRMGVRRRDALPAAVPGGHDRVDHAEGLGASPVAMTGDPVEALRRVPLFAGLDERRGRADRAACSRSAASPRARRSSGRARAAPRSS